MESTKVSSVVWNALSFFHTQGIRRWHRKKRTTVLSRKDHILIPYEMWAKYEAK